MQPDYYHILGVSHDATAEQIRQAYRAKAKLYHPDINNKPSAKAAFQLVSEAYQILINNEKRRWYDFKLKYPVYTSGRTRSNTSTNVTESYYRAYAKNYEARKNEAENINKRKTIADNAMYYFFVIAGVFGLTITTFRLFFLDWNHGEHLSGIFFAVPFLIVLFYGWRILWKK